MGRWAALGLAGLAAAGLVAVLWWPAPAPPPEAGPGAPALERLQALAGEFPRPEERPLRLPEDHAAKPGHFAEYWLLGGRLEDGAGRAYGFQVMLARLAVAAGDAGRDSPWAAREVYRGHLVVAPASGRGQAAERYQRGAMGLGGAGGEPVRVWVEDWALEIDHDGGAAHLRATEEGAGLGLELRLRLPAVGPAPVGGPEQRGYWWPGLAAEGTLTRDGEAREVRGGAFLDRMWGRGLAMGRGQLALTRAWLALDDGRALRCRQLRRRAGGGTPLGECLVRTPAGETTTVGRAGLRLEPRDDGWRELGGVRYPLAWELAIDEAGVALAARPLAEPHEPFALPLWSGSLAVEGSGDGWGVLELSNYRAP